MPRTFSSSSSSSEIIDGVSPLPTPSPIDLEDTPSSQDSSCSRNPIWKYFQLRSDDPSDAICLTCQSQGSKKYTVSRGKKNSKNLGTTSLRNHLENKHPGCFQEMKAMSRKPNPCEQPKIKTAFETVKKWPASQRKEMLILDEMPYITVQNEGYSRWRNFALPNYDDWCRTHYTDVVVPAIDAGVRREMRKSPLFSVDWVALTTDIWTSIANDA